MGVYPGTDGRELRMVEAIRFYDDYTDFLVPEDDVKARLGPASADVLLTPKALADRIGTPGSWGWGFYLSRRPHHERFIVVVGYALPYLIELGVADWPRIGTT